MAKGLSKRKQKQIKDAAVIKDLQKIGKVENSDNVKKRKKGDDKQTWKNFRFSQVVRGIQSDNQQDDKLDDKKQRMSESFNDSLDNDQSFFSKDESAENSAIILDEDDEDEDDDDDDDDEIPVADFHSSKTEENVMIDNNMQLTEVADVDAKYFAANANEESIYGILLLKSSVEVTVHGKFQIEVLKGRVEILGCEVTPERGLCPVYSSELSGALRIQESNCEDKSQICDESMFRMFEKVFGLELDDLKERLQSCSTVVLFRKLVSLEMDFICSSRSYQNLFPDVPKVEIAQAQQSVSINVSSWKNSADDILKTLSEFKGPSSFRILLCGNKNTGKSTFARYLINSMLSRFERSVFFLECDVGQTEFTPPCIISLSRVDKPILGPPFTHQKCPILSIFFGTNTSKDDPTRYIRCIQEAFEFYMKYHESEGPLIINTQGWVKGLGLPMLVDTIKIIGPKFVLQFKTQVEVERGFNPLNNEVVQSHPGWVLDESKANLSSTDPEMLDSENDTLYHIVETNHKRSTEHQQFKSVDYRKLSLIAYFSPLFVSEDVRPRTRCLIERPLSSLVPRVVFWKDVAVHVIHSKVAPSLIMASLNFSMVSLSIVDPKLIVELPKEHLPDGPKFLAHNPIASHIGFGFIRNIDVEKKAFIILTPVPYEQLIDVNALLKGNVDMPLELFQTGILSSERLYSTPEMRSHIRGTRARKPRYNLKRRKFDSPSVTA